MIFENLDQLHHELDSIVDLTEDQLVVHDNAKLLDFGIDYLIYSGVLSVDAQVRHLCRVYIRKLAKQMEVIPSSIHALYEAFGKGEVKGFTTPAFNMRAMTYDVARVIFKKAIEMEAGSFIFEISRSEMKYTLQLQDEVAVCILAAAIKEGFTGPVFLQGDHYQFDIKKFKEYPQGQIDEIELSAKDALSAGFYNIDIDASTLVDLGKGTTDEQQKDNFEMTALLTKFIRSMQPGGITVTIGGEIGHIGGVNSTVEDFKSFMKGYLDIIEVAGLAGISKVSVQTGTSHGGTVDASGKLTTPDVDMTVIENIGKVAREEYGLGGPVQHGASTLPNEMFDAFPKAGAVEIHLATGIQNIIFDTIPEDLRQKMYEYVKTNLQEEREEGWSDEQFLYKLRKKAIGPHKKDMWLISEADKEKIREKLGEQFGILFEKLNLKGTSHTVRKYIA